jgi:Ca-activated chloride channel homolog
VPFPLEVALRVVFGGAHWRQRVTRLCVWLAVAGVVLAAARPLVPTQATRHEGILELVVDVSGSTAATDVAPSRLVAMEQAALRLLDQLPPRVRVGLVSFSGSATTLAQPTTDRDLIRRELRSLSAGGATAIGDALRFALSQIRSAGLAVPATVLLLSDGSPPGQRPAPGGARGCPRARPRPRRHRGHPQRDR